MPKYLIKLSNGKYSKVTASSPLKAKYKYYSSKSHFKTEAAVKNIKKIETKYKKRILKNPWRVINKIGGGI